MMRFALLLSVLVGCSPSTNRLELKDLAIAKRFPLDGAAAYSIIVSKGVAFVAVAEGFRSIQLNKGDDAVQLAAYTVVPQSPQSNQPLALKGNLLAVAHASRIVLVDVADPANPVTLSTIVIGSEGAGRSMVFDGEYLYWGGINLQRAIVTDPTNPGAPEIISAEAASAFLIKDGRIYVSGTSAMRVLSLPDPAIEHSAAPTLGTAAVTMAGDVILNGTALYGTVGGLGNVWVVDVKDPAAPVVVHAVSGSQGGFNAQGAGLWLAGTQLLAPALNGLTYDYDVSTPLEPKEVAAKVVARNFDDASNFDVARWEEQLLLGNARGFFVLTASLR